MEFDMIWTAITEKNGTYDCRTFTTQSETQGAFAEISEVLNSDGWKVVGMLKGSHCSIFYGVNQSGDLLGPKDL